MSSKPLYLCYATGCCTIMSNTSETISEHFMRAHGWTAQECQEYFSDEVDD